ncbi:MAG TPA: hypothetical protein VK470_03950 [Bacteroidota bacterium]|nr:hypothetical protein [Bacteroidota bacterium]
MKHNRVVATACRTIIGGNGNEERGRDSNPRPVHFNLKTIGYWILLREDIKTEIAVQIELKMNSTPLSGEIIFVTNKIIVPPEIIPAANNKMIL